MMEQASGKWFRSPRSHWSRGRLVDLEKEDFLSPVLRFPCFISMKRRNSCHNKSLPCLQKNNAELDKFFNLD